MSGWTREALSVAGVWVDDTSRYPGEEVGAQARSWRADRGGVRIRVHRHSTDMGRWFVTCDLVGLLARRLVSLEADDARMEALHVVRDALQAGVDSVSDLISSGGAQ